MKGSAFCSWSTCQHPGKICRWATQRARAVTNLEVLVRGLLPFLVHSVWCGLGEHANGGEDGKTGEDAHKDTKSDLLGLIWRSLSTGTVRTESNPVRCEAFRLADAGQRYYEQTHVEPARGGQVPIELVQWHGDLGTDPRKMAGCSMAVGRCVIGAGRGVSGRLRRLTSLLLLDRQAAPVLLHAVTQGHPQLGLLLQRHALPPLLNVGQGGVRDGVASGGGDSRSGRGGATSEDGSGLTAGEAGAQRS